MKTLITIAILLIASTAKAQDFYSYGTGPAIYTRSWSYSISTYGNYGYGYGFPSYRYQIYQEPQTYWPGYQGAIPGAWTRGYFIPGVYGYGW